VRFKHIDREGLAAGLFVY